MADKKELQRQLRYVIRLLNNPFITDNQYMRSHTTEVFSDVSHRLDIFCKVLDKLEKNNGSK